MWAKETVKLEDGEMVDPMPRPPNDDFPESPIVGRENFQSGGFADCFTMQDILRQTLNPKTSIPNPKPQTVILNPKPQTVIQASLLTDCFTMSDIERHAAEYPSSYAAQGALSPDGNGGFRV